MKTKIVAVLLAMASHVAFAGSITNGDFGTGNLAGWTASGSVSVINSGSYNSASLIAGTSDVATTLSRLVHLDAGDVLSGRAQFFAHDYEPFNDDAFVSVNGFTVFFSDVVAVGGYGTGALTSFRYYAATTGDYLLTAGVTNRLDALNSSELQVSGFAVNPGAVPEPATVALLGLGMLGLAATRRRKAAGKPV